jgi:hypothetical protein
MSLYQTEEQSTIGWLIENRWISRLTLKDMENQLINKCADNVDCTEEEHQLNRRSEFIIMEL